MVLLTREFFADLWRRCHPPWQSKPGSKHDLLVRRDPRAYWEQKNWRSNRNSFEGWFRTPYGSWRGRAERAPGGVIEVYIKNPPDFISYSPHRHCIHDRGDGWHSIHVTNGLRDLSSGIITIEHLLCEAFLRYRNSRKGRHI